MWGASLHPCQFKVNTHDSKPVGYVPLHPHPLTPIPPSPHPPFERGEILGGNKGG